MIFRNRRGLKEEADRLLSQAALDPRKLMLIYVGATALLMLAATALNYILQLQIDGTGGLSGLGMRSALQTAAEVLQMAVSLVVPFWTMGYVSAVLRMARGQEFGTGTLLDGFRNFGPVLRLNLLRSALYVGICFVCCYLGMQIFLLTPLADPIYAAMESLTEVSGELVLDDAALAAVEQAMIPMLVLCGILCAVVVLPVYYGLRLADFALMDDPKAGARAAMSRSRAMMKGNKISLFRLDLSFWWFYLLDGLLMVLCYGDVVLSLLGVTLPFNADTAYFVFYVVYLVAQLCLYVWAKNKVECTYALGYDEARRDLLQRMSQMVRQAPYQPEQR